MKMSGADDKTRISKGFFLHTHTHTHNFIYISTDGFQIEATKDSMPSWLINIFMYKIMFQVYSTYVTLEYWSLLTYIFVLHITYMEKITGLAMSAVYNKYMLWLCYVQTYSVQELSWLEETPPPHLSPSSSVHALGCMSSLRQLLSASFSLRWQKCNQLWGQRRERNGCWTPAFLGT